MRKIVLYVLVLAALFSWVDWQTVHQTRWVHRDALPWAHNAEKAYARFTGTVEFALCAPCMALKPVFYWALMSVEASKEEQAAITHAPGPSLQGFYRLLERGYSWTFVPWTAWLLYWSAPSALWLALVERLFRKT